MIKLVVAAIILIIIMITFVFILFKNIIKRININAKTFFVNKMQNYDYILQEKQKELEELKKNIEILKSDQTHLELENDDLEMEYRNKEKLLENTKNTSVQYNLNVPKYRETQFFENYKEIKNVFSINNEQIIKDFISEHKNRKENQEYKKLNKIREMFDDNTIYECLTLDQNIQKDVLQDVLTDDEKKLVNINQIIQQDNFSIKDFVKMLDDRMEEIDPTIYVFVNGNTNAYEKIDKNIVVRQYSNMSEGIIIKYRNKIYDYSI